MPNDIAGARAMCWAPPAAPDGPGQPPLPGRPRKTTQLVKLKSAPPPLHCPLGVQTSRPRPPSRPAAPTKDSEAHDSSAPPCGDDSRRYVSPNGLGAESAAPTRTHMLASPVATPMSRAASHTSPTPKDCVVPNLHVAGPAALRLAAISMARRVTPTRCGSKPEACPYRPAHAYGTSGAIMLSSKLTPCARLALESSTDAALPPTGAGFCGVCALWC